MGDGTRTNEEKGEMMNERQDGDGNIALHLMLGTLDSLMLLLPPSFLCSTMYTTTVCTEYVCAHLLRSPRAIWHWMGASTEKKKPSLVFGATVVDSAPLEYQGGGGHFLRYAPRLCCVCVCAPFRLFSL